MFFTTPSIIATGHGIPLISLLLSSLRGPKGMLYPWNCSYSDEFTLKASNQCQPLNSLGFCYSRSTMSESTIVLITGKIKIPVAPVSCTLLTLHRRQLGYWLCNSSNSCVPAELSCNNGQSRSFEGTGSVCPAQNCQSPRNTLCHSTGC